MTLAECAANVGEKVTYLSAHAREMRCCDPEPGVIERVGKYFAHVRYAGGVMATAPEDLTLVAGGEPS